jgi:hypothetical protein
MMVKKDVVEAIVMNPVGGTSLLVDDVMTKPAITVIPACPFQTVIR